MTADEIVRVLGPPSEARDDLSEEEDGAAGVVNGLCAGEVIVDQEGEWHSALELRRSGDRYLIHTCPGYGAVEMSENEWVKADRVRFPASSSGQDGSPRGSADPTFDAGSWCGHPKEEPVPAEVSWPAAWRPSAGRPTSPRSDRGTGPKVVAFHDGARMDAARDSQRQSRWLGQVGSDCTGPIDSCTHSARRTWPLSAPFFRIWKTSRHRISYNLRTPGRAVGVRSARASGERGSGRIQTRTQQCGMCETNPVFHKIFTISSRQCMQ